MRSRLHTRARGAWSTADRYSSVAYGPQGRHRIHPTRACSAPQVWHPLMVNRSPAWCDIARRAPPRTLVSVLSAPRTRDAPARERAQPRTRSMRTRKGCVRACCRWASVLAEKRSASHSQFCHAGPPNSFAAMTSSSERSCDTELCQAVGLGELRTPSST